MGRTGSGFLVLGLLLALCPATPRGDSCGPREPVKIPAVCGRTVFGVGWIKPQLRWSLDRIWPDQPLELRERKGKLIATTVSDADGRFAFKGIHKGSYILTAPEGQGLWTLESVIVTETNAACDRPLYVELGEAGWPCRVWATAIPPVDLQPLEPEGQHSNRIVPPRDARPIESCVAGADAAAPERYASIDVTDEGRITVVGQDCRRHTFEDVPRSHRSYPYVTATQAAVSPDHSAAAWLALFRPCASCTDLVQPFELVVLHHSKTQRITAGNGMPIWFWMFRDGGKQIAFKQGIDDPEILRYELWDVASGTRLADYTPTWDKNFHPIGPKPPRWARDLDAAEDGR